MQPKMQRVQTNRLLFNGHDLGDLVFCKVARPVMAPVNAIFEEVSGRNGELFKSAHLSGFDLPVEIWLRSEDRYNVATIRHKLANALFTENPAPLYLPDDPHRYLMAIVSGSTDLGTITNDCPYTTITFHVGDPFYYGRARRLSVKAGTFTFNVGGDRPAHLSITAYPSNSDPWYIRNVDTGEQVKLSSSTTATSTVRLDMNLERATVNNQTAAVTLDSDFFAVQGRARLQLSSGRAMLEWRERWV